MIVQPRVVYPTVVALQQCIVISTQPPISSLTFISVLRPLSVSLDPSVVLLSPLSRFRNLRRCLFMLCHCPFPSSFVFVHVSVLPCPRFSFFPRQLYVLRSHLVLRLRSISLVRLCFGLCALDYALHSFRAGKSGCQNARAGHHGVLFTDFCLYEPARWTSPFRGILSRVGSM